MRSFLRIDDAEEDPLLAALLEGAVTALDGREGVLGRALVNQTWRLDCAGPDASGIVRIGLAGVSQVTGVTSLISGVATPWTGYQLQHDAYGAYVAANATSTWPDQDIRDDAISVTFVAGYGPASAVPEALKLAIRVLAAHRYHNRESAGWPSGLLDIVMPHRFLRI
jgi:uncharacterized phiE125 gp8 family phage protein